MILYPVAILYAVWLVDWILPFKLNAFGLIPRTQEGLIGIVTSPFLHGDVYHLASNTVPLVVLLATLLGFYESKFVKVILGTILLSGVMLWLFGRSANHIGASGLIYGLAGFLVANGLMERNFKALLISLVIGFLYSSLIFGVLPSNPQISWEGHLFGLIAGVVMSYVLSEKSQVARVK